MGLNDIVMVQCEWTESCQNGYCGHREPHAPRYACQPSKCGHMEDSLCECKPVIKRVEPISGREYILGLQREVSELKDEIEKMKVEIHRNSMRGYKDEHFC